jgi:hypothetical protein
MDKQPTGVGRYLPQLDKRNLAVMQVMGSAIGGAHNLHSHDIPGQLFGGCHRLHAESRIFATKILLSAPGIRPC